MIVTSQGSPKIQIKAVVKLLSRRLVDCVQKTAADCSAAVFVMDVVYLVRQASNRWIIAAACARVALPCGRR